MPDKMLFLSDLHLHNYRMFGTVNGNGVNSRLEEIIETCRGALDVAKAEGCRHCCILGDILHVRGNLKASVFSEFVKLIVQFSTAFETIVLIPGNHDMESHDTKTGYTSIDVFKHFQVRGFGNVHYLNMRSMRVGDYNLIGLGYCHRPEDFNEALGRVTAYRHEVFPNVFLIHQGVDDFGNKNIPKTGVTVERLRLMTGPDDWVFSGHYHSPKASPDGKVVMVGSPCHHSFGDAGERGCWVFDGKKAVFHELPGPRFATYTTLERPYSAFKKEIAGAKGQYCRVVVKDVKTALKAEKDLKEAGAKGVLVEVEREFVPKHDTGLTVGGDLKDMVARYIDAVPEYKPKKAKLLKLFERVEA